jgi:hypothetical protein
VEVQSPVGTFPLRLSGVKIDSGGLRVRTTMGAWRSEVRLGREDAPMIAAVLGSWILTYLWGRRQRGAR